MPAQVKVTLVRSLSGRTQPQRKSVKGLGLRRLHHTVTLEDTPSVRGMIRKVEHMVEVEEVEE